MATAHPDPKARQASLNGIRMAFTDEGQGTALLLVHGFPLNRHAWRRQVEAFRGTCRVIAPDLRGMGESSGTPGPVAMTRFAEDLHALVEHLEAGPVILVGHSMGGYVALAFAKAFAGDLQGLVLVGTRAGADSPQAAVARRETAEQVRLLGPSAMAEGMAAKMLSPENHDAAMAAEVRALMAPSSQEGLIGALLGMADRPDANAWIGEIAVPTLVIAGADDAIIPPGESEAMARALPAARLKLIPRAGHLVPWEAAEAFNGALREWLPGSTGQAASK